MSSAAEEAPETSTAGEDAGPDAVEGVLGGFLLALRTRGIRDPELLLAIERTPRARFLSADYAAFAQHDMALPIPCGQQATSPFVVAEALLHLEPTPRHRVLEIGTGSGWQAAVLARRSRSVVTIERFAALHRDAEDRLRRLGLANVTCRHGDGALGAAEDGPYDRIIVNAAVAALPPILLRQLAPNGVVVAPLLAGGAQHLARFTAADGQWTALAPASFSDLRAGVALAT